MDKYQEDLVYLKEYLQKNNGDKDANENLEFRSKYHHTLRVIKWIERIVSEEKIPSLDMEVLYLSAVYHDIGYDNSGRKNHAERSPEIFRRHSVDLKLSDAKKEKIAYNIENHSKKELIQTDIELEFCILMEADLMDELGALGIIWDCIIRGRGRIDSYREVIEHIEIGYRKLQQNPMKTRTAKRLWEDKREFVKNFLEEAEFELEEESEGR